MKNFSYMLLGLLLCTVSAQAQILSVVKWSYAAKKTSATEAVLYMKAIVQPSWHVFSVNQKPGGPQKTDFAFSKSTDYTLIGKVIEPQPIVKFDQTFGIEIMYFENEVIFQQKVKILRQAQDELKIKGKVAFMACNESQCLPPDQIEFSLTVK